MSDIIHQAFSKNKNLRNWDDLATWLRFHGKEVNGVKGLIEASQHAQQDGLLFPNGPEEARLIIKKYQHQPL